MVHFAFEAVPIAAAAVVKAEAEVMTGGVSTITPALSKFAWTENAFLIDVAREMQLLSFLLLLAQLRF